MKPILMAAALAAVALSTSACMTYGSVGVGYERGHHGYSSGSYLSSEYRNDNYAVNDWRQRGWQEPPAGYRYYRTPTGEVVLAAIATGLITALILHAF